MKKYNVNDSSSDDENIEIAQENEIGFNVKGYQRNTIRIAIFYISVILTGGFIWLIGYWYPWKRVKYTHTRCGLNQAQIVIVNSNDGFTFVCHVKEHVLALDENEQLDVDEFVGFERNILKGEKFRYFKYMFLTYLILDDVDIMELSGLDAVLTYPMILKYSNSEKAGNSRNARELRQHVFGENHIHVPVRSYFVHIAKEAANPFYLFQVFSFTLWSYYGYFIFPIVIASITVLSVLTTAYQTRKQMKDLQNMVGQPYQVKCLHQDKHVVEKSSAELVPGDVLLIPEEGMDAPCDLVVLESTCVVNESSLTGESFPISKVALDLVKCTKDQIYVIDNEKNHTVQYGTRVLQASCHDDRQYIRSLVIRTGFSTMKGRLIRDIMFPKPISFVFYKECFRFILFLVVLGVIGFVYKAVLKHANGDGAVDILLQSLDVVTIIVPPVLPACLSIGIVFALRKLKKHRIFCIDSQRINLCGHIDLFVFDKTGTITEDHLDVKCAWTYDKEAGEFVKVTTQSIGNESESKIVKGMSVCHSLHMIDGVISGRPEDLEMFHFSGWSLHKNSGTVTHVEPPSTNGNCITIVKEFQFESSLQRMSVITKESGHNFVTVYMKGSPEMVKSLCNPNSIPGNYQEFVREGTVSGYRVLAIACKQIDTKDGSIDGQNLPRSSIESNLDFVGFVVFENSIKPNSKETIATLRNGGVGCIIATGDHLFTAVSVAKEIDIIYESQSVYQLLVEEGKVVCEQIKNTHSAHDQNRTVENPRETSKLIQENPISSDNPLKYSLILTGEVYQTIKLSCPELLPNVLTSASVYARMSPVDKTSLVEDFKNAGYGVGMCGDGANDCGALKAAHAGIALSEMEASVAAPFTSKVFNISCVPALVREGRAALVTSFSVFKYMALYGFIQFFGVLILAAAKSTYSDYQFFYVDLFVVFLLAIAITQNETSSQLAKEAPPARLSDARTIMFVVLQLFMVLIFQVIPYVIVKLMPWYLPPRDLKKNEMFMLPSYENYAVLGVSFYQYIWAAIVCTTGEPYLKPLYKNPWFVCIFIGDVVVTTILVFSPFTFIKNILEFPDNLPAKFGFGLVAYSVLNLIVVLVVNKLINMKCCGRKVCVGNNIESAEILTMTNKDRPPFHIRENNTDI